MDGFFDFSDDLMNVDVTDFEKAMEENKKLAERIATERIQEEMIQYVISLINQEYHGNSPEDAYEKWEDYKKKRGIDINAI